MSFKAWIARHPRLTAWAVLAVGMVVILIWAARNVGLLPGQWAALIVATILLAGLCVWIIGWDNDEEGQQPAAGTEAETKGMPEPAVEIPPETKEQGKTQAEG
jgi:hypothetical protein